MGEEVLMPMRFCAHLCCPVCGKSDFHRKYKAHKTLFDFLKRRGGQFVASGMDIGVWYDLYRCRVCEHVFVKDYPESLDSFYTEGNTDAYKWRRKGRTRDFKRLVREAYGVFGTRQIQAVLDIGCCTGDLLSCFPASDLFGLEPGCCSFKEAHARFGDSIVKGFFSSYSIDVLRSRGFRGADLVCATDVIEHVVDLIGFMELVRECALKPGGVVCFITPSVSSFASLCMGRFWWHYRAMHMHYFSRFSMTHLLQRAGFTPLWMGVIPRWVSCGGAYVPLFLGDMMVFGRRNA